MHLRALATAVPEHVFTQRQCWELAQRSGVDRRLNARSMVILQRVLTSDNGIDRRRFAPGSPDALLDYDADALNAAFRRLAPALAGRALTTALAEAGLAPAELDALLICTCTGYLCPGVSSYVAEQLGLRPDIFLQDLVGLGCGAALPTLRTAQGLLAATPTARVAVVAVEICSAAFYLDDDPGVLISACLFGDGAAACILEADATPSATAPARGLRFHSFDTLHQPEHRDRLRFEQRDGKLRNLLHISVPTLAAEAVATLWSRRGPRPVADVLSHSGGRDVLQALRRVLPGHDLATSEAVLRDHGNMSSPSVLFALAEARRARTAPPSGTDWWLTTFGAGFAAHCCRVSAA